MADTLKIDTTRKTNVVGEIIRYENGEMDEAEMIEFFQGLVDSGLAWTLQGHYGRTANDLLQAGLITQNGETDAEFDARQAREYKEGK